MAGITGPISTLPGAAHDLPPGTRCDSHPERLAVSRIQGETDSFGSELLDYCEECASRAREDMGQPKIGRCDWCEADAKDLRDHRDYDEGLHGPVYRVCGACRQREAAQIEREFEDDIY